jgi:[ribosomal protein S5]-alanine N-acetyltransferase
MIPTLETPRLILRAITLADAPAVQARFPHWEIVQFLGAQVPWPYPPDGAETNIRAMLERAETTDAFAWAICLKSAPDDLIGRIDLRPLDPATRTQRGFWIAKEHWGQGLITEAANRVVDFAFDDLGWSELWVTNAAANIASSRVKRRQGFTLVETDEHAFVSGLQQREIWRITATEWFARDRI